MAVIIMNKIFWLFCSDNEILTNIKRTFVWWEIGGCCIVNGIITTFLSTASINLERFSVWLVYKSLRSEVFIYWIRTTKNFKHGTLMNGMINTVLTYYILCSFLFSKVNCTVWTSYGIYTSCNIWDYTYIIWCFSDSAS